jgi:hypothetical protein
VRTGKRIRNWRFSARAKTDLDCPGTLAIYDPRISAWETMRTFNVPTQEANIQNVSPSRDLGQYLQNVAGLPAGNAGVQLRFQCQRAGATNYVLSIDQVRLDYEIER